MIDPRDRTGSVGEDVAVWWLSGQGLRVVDRNVDLGHGEVDLVARDGGQKVVVEVRATTGRGDPIDAIDDDKRRRVRRLAGAVGATRVDLIGVGFGADALIVHWVPG